MWTETIVTAANAEFILGGAAEAAGSKGGLFLEQMKWPKQRRVGKSGSQVSRTR